MKRLHGAAATLAVGVAMFAGSAIASAATVYDNIPTPTPGNVPSEAFEAQSASEFGGQVDLAGTGGPNPVVSVLMSSWGCEDGNWNLGNCVTTPDETFSHPLTLNVYAVNGDNSPGTLLASQTKPFDIPYRPSADPVCTGANAGKWFDGTSCFNGKAVQLAFNPLGITLPDKVIVSLAYNTTHYGATPMTESAPCYSESGGCGYDSLNVGLAAPPEVGATPLPADAYLDSSWSGAYCDNGVGGTGTFRLDSGCWTGFQPAIQVDVPVGPPTSKDQCKKDGWKAFDTPRRFKNQGDCVSYFATGGKHG